MKNQVVLIGVAGAGKSDVATELSQQLNWPIHDALKNAAEIAGEDMDLLFVRRGAEEFQTFVAQGVIQALNKPGIVVLSPDSVLVEDVQEKLKNVDKNQALIIELYADFNTLAQRTGINAPRAVNLGPIRRTFRLLMESYRECYSQLAHEKLDTSLSKPHFIAERIVALLG